MPPDAHLLHDAQRIVVGQVLNGGDPVVHALAVVGQHRSAFDIQIDRVADHQYVRVESLREPLVKCGLGLRQAAGVVVPRVDDHLDVVRYVLQVLRELGVLVVDVVDYELLVLVGEHPDTVDDVAREDDVVDVVLHGVGLEPGDHLVPVLLQERAAPHVDIR